MRMKIWKINCFNLAKVSFHPKSEKLETQAPYFMNNFIVTVDLM